MSSSESETPLSDPAHLGGLAEVPTTPEDEPGAEKKVPDPTGPFSAALTPSQASGVRPARPSEMEPVSTFGRYEVLGRIALGGMAEIFLAREHLPAGVSRVLVIKKVLEHVADDERFVSMFLDEARLAMKLSHPNICHIYEFGREEGAYFIAMEWVNGVPLGRAIKYTRRESGAGLPPPLAARVIAATAEALDYAHSASDETGTALNIVHRDVSPQNIMISYQGGIKLLDFGIAKATSHDTKTSDGQVKGKYAYMSPQQCKGDPIDGRADVFALGVCLYESLTARNLYRRPTEYESMRAIIEDPVPSARSIDPQIPEELEQIMQKALAKEPGDRFATAGEMQNTLERWLADNAHVVNAAVLSGFVGQLFPDEKNRAPVVSSAPAPNFREANFRDNSARSPDSEASQSDAFVAAPEPKKSGGVAVALLFAGLIIAVAMVSVAWMVRSSFLTDSDPVATTTAPDETAPEPAPPPDELPAWEAPEDEAAAWEGGSWDAPEEGETRAVAEPSGAIEVTSRPAGASVRINDSETEQRTPFTFENLEPGTYTFRIRKSGFRTLRRTVELGDGATESVTVALAEGPTAPAGQTGTISVNSRPWSRVSANGRALGSTPLRATVPAGVVRLQLETADGRTHNRTARVTPGEHTRISLDLTGP